MPLDRVRATEAISKPEFHARLRAWLSGTDEPIVGPPGDDERTAWVYVRDGAARYKLHADANRAAVTEYLQLADRFGEDIEWRLVANANGRMNAVAFGPEAVRLRNRLYLYLAGSTRPDGRRGRPAVGAPDVGQEGRSKPAAAPATRPPPGDWVTYWTPDGFRQMLGEPLLNRIASAQLDRLRIGDRVWVVAAPAGRLVTLGWVPVLEPAVGRAEARRRLGREPYDAPFHLFVPDADARPPRECDLHSLAGILRFESRASDRLILADGKVNGQQMQTMRRLTPESAALVEARWRDATGEDATVPDAGMTSGDRAALRAIRTEQQQLRRLLFGGNEVARCVLCGSEYPVGLLVAAHVKRRSACTQAERDDWRHNVVPMCLLGCDALFERGYLIVDDGRVALGPAAVANPAVRDRLGPMADRPCPHWSAESAAYFGWHAVHAPRAPQE
jgi:hypothetical protein